MRMKGGTKLLLITACLCCLLIFFLAHYNTRYFIETAKDSIQNLNGFARNLMAPMPPRTKKMDLIIRSAFFDSRPRDGHDHSLVIFAEVSKEIRRYQLIKGCGIDRHSAEVYTVNTLNWLYIDLNYPHLTHEEIIITCYDVSIKQDGSIAFVDYYETLSSKVLTKKRINIMYPKEKKRGMDSTVVCTTCFGRPSWLSQWLRYQKTLGVNLVQMYAEETFLIDSQNIETIKAYVDEGFLKIEHRKTYFNSNEIYYHSQILNYNDCLYRYQGVSDFIIFYDIDEYFVPRLHTTRLTDYLKRFLRGSYVAVQFVWNDVFPDCGFTQPPGSIVDGNLTSILKVKEQKPNFNYKFACKPSMITQVSVHEPRYLLSTQSDVYYADWEEAYIAHFRLGQLHQSSCETLL